MSKRLSPLRSIKLYCRQCSADSPTEVKKCPIPDCPLYVYRFGHNEARRGIGGGFRPQQVVESANSTEKEP
jgi:hypothetical protein